MNYLKILLKDTKLKKILLNLYYGNYAYYLWILPINKRKVIITNYYGNGYGDSGKYLEKEIKKSDNKYEVYWVVKEKTIEINGVNTVVMNSFKYKYHMATAKIWIDNCRKNSCPPKRKKQKYIQLWHGFGPKRIEEHVESSLSSSYVYFAKKDSKMFDYLISPCKTFTNVISKSFWFDGPVLEIGLPRNEILENKINSDSKGKLEKYIGRKIEGKIILYAPTFRKNMEFGSYDIDLERLKNNFEKRFGEQCVILVRYHSNLNVKDTNEVENSYISNVSEYPDMTELLSVADCYITDYSSAMTDFLLTDRLCLLYASDINEYNQDRGFYFNLDTVTGHVSENNEELESYILNFDESEYFKNIKEFKERHGLRRYPNSSKDIVKLMDSLR